MHLLLWQIVLSPEFLSFGVDLTNIYAQFLANWEKLPINRSYIGYVNISTFCTTLIGENRSWETKNEHSLKMGIHTCWWNWHMGISSREIGWSNLHFTLTMNAMVKMLVQSRTKQTLKILSRKHVSDIRLFSLQLFVQNNENGSDVRSIIWLETSSIIIDQKRRDTKCVKCFRIKLEPW